MEYVFCITRLLTFDCKLAVRISQRNIFFLKKVFSGCLDSWFSSVLKIRHFSLSMLYWPVLSIVYINHILKKKQSDQLEYCFCTKQWGYSELYICAEGYYLWFTFNFNWGEMNAYCNGVNFIDNKLYTMKLPLGYCRFVFLMNLGFPLGWTYTVYFAIVTSRPTDQIVVLRWYLTFCQIKYIDSFLFFSGSALCTFFSWGRGAWIVSGWGPGRGGRGQNLDFALAGFGELEPTTASRRRASALPTRPAA